MASGGLTIKELNDLLDRLASSENRCFSNHKESILFLFTLLSCFLLGSRAEKTLVLSTLIQKTNAQEMKWVIRIILKGRNFAVSSHKVSIFFL